jgi:hypothetical protein
MWKNRRHEFNKKTRNAEKAHRNVFENSKSDFAKKCF